MTLSILAIARREQRKAAEAAKEETRCKRLDAIPVFDRRRLWSGNVTARKMLEGIYRDDFDVLSQLPAPRRRR
jgi:hypothetical protein